MAKWMAKELKKTKKFEAFDPDLIKTFTKDAKWRVDTGFEEDVTARLKQMKTAYVLYGKIQKYRVENFILNDFWRTDEPQVPLAILEFWFRMMDLNGNNNDQEFIMNGDSIADPRDRRTTL
jgi:hypothetical protein